MTRAASALATPGSRMASRRCKMSRNRRLQVSVIAQSCRVRRLSSATPPGARQVFSRQVFLRRGYRSAPLQRDADIARHAARKIDDLIGDVIAARLEVLF